MQKIVLGTARAMVCLMVVSCLGCSQKSSTGPDVEAKRRKLDEEKKQLQEERKKFEEERALATKRPLEELLLGSWAPADLASDLQGVTLSKDRSGSVVSHLFQEENKHLRDARYVLVGKYLEITVVTAGSIQGGAWSSWKYKIDVVSATDRELVIRRDLYGKNREVITKAKEERLVRP